ncbi:hypothetical protein LOD99_9439 [Oopsacas minuta]|uniref:cystathionine gamma-lyase n=1 Tax=Oopsacas minuta TaxID=111878 RepID=A0AAV7JBS5_9METZ|nr:hypothetical protein LOD99_9439 [Oopsacas minuta]
MSTKLPDKSTQGTEHIKHFGTNAIHAGYEPEQWKSKAIMPPIINSTIFKLDNPEFNEDEYIYTRMKNPTRDSLETCLAMLENANHAYVFSSGMSATSTAVSALVHAGDRVLATNAVYGGTYSYLCQYAKDYKICVEFVDVTNLDTFKAALTPETSLVWLECPTNPMLTIIDIAALARIAKSYPSNPVVVVDNTFMSSYFQQPLCLGADVTMQSLSKYMGGHSDVLMGCLVTNRHDLADKFKSIQMSVGSVSTPFDCYLMIRGLKTLHLRMREHQRNALAVANFLESHKEVDLVLYPGLPSHPQHELAKKQCYGFSGIVTFRLKGTIDTAKIFLKSLKVILSASSLGGCESVACIPSITTHAYFPVDVKLKLGITGNLVRLSIGLEEVSDLIQDLDVALTNAARS